MRSGGSAADPSSQFPEPRTPAVRRQGQVGAPARCGRCDNCRAGDTRVRAQAPFAVGDRVRHTEWAPGTVMISAPDRVVVLFGEHGYRTVATELVLDEGLLATDDLHP